MLLIFIIYYVSVHHGFRHNLPCQYGRFLAHRHEPPSNINNYGWQRPMTEILLKIIKWPQIQVQGTPVTTALQAMAEKTARCAAMCSGSGGDGQRWSGTWERMGCRIEMLSLDLGWVEEGDYGGGVANQKLAGEIFRLWQTSRWRW